MLWDRVHYPDEPELDETSLKETANQQQPSLPNQQYTGGVAPVSLAEYQVSAGETSRQVQQQDSDKKVPEKSEKKEDSDTVPHKQVHRYGEFHLGRTRGASPLKYFAMLSPLKISK